MGVHVQILRSTRITQRGQTRTIYPGDSVEVSRAIALQWEAEGIARPWRAIALTAEETANVRFFAGNEAAAERLRQFVSAVARVDVRDELPALAQADVIDSERVVWFDGTTPLDVARLASGLEVIFTWDAAAPLDDYRVLAADVGSEEDRQATAELGIDLRCPVYAPGLLFLRWREGRELIDLLSEEMVSGGDRRLAFLRAYWRSTVRLCPLPATWSGAKV
ncbi:MAG: hypothetical protein L6Q98_19845 [Anaerolineae bacterium]|nr:hypothetical protein [Anaerolineae bacterium]NUQ06893.1 hypothetical protein [Anaerolineae bacterium]